MAGWVRQGAASGAHRSLLLLDDLPAVGRAARSQHGRLAALSQNLEIGEYKEQEFVAASMLQPQTPALMCLFAFTIDIVRYRILNVLNRCHAR